MEFTKIISSPVFAGSAPDIGLKAQSAGDVTLKVSTPEFSWEIVLSTLKNSAGENLVTIRLRDILSSVTAAPSPSETDADAALPLLFVNLAASNSEGEQVSTDIPVAYGNLTGKSPADFIGQWLTSREQVSRTYTWARERLSLIFGPQLLRWSGQVTLKIKCKAYFLSGSPETFELASVSSSENTYYTADCSYARIAALAESESPLVAWDLSYTLTGTDADGEPASLESYPQRFLLGRQDERIREFIFVNCFGMEDRVFGEGISKRKVDGSSTTFIAGGQKMEVSNDSETVFEAFSGQLADRRSIFHWHDFLSSATRLLLRPTDASLTRIVIDSHDSETEDFSVGGINFSYRLSDRHSDYPGGLYGSIGDYDPTQQFGALWVDKDPAAVAPEEGDLFFLKHRLSEFPSFNVADELLFLVQSPLTDAWGAFSVGNLKLWIGKFIDNGAKSIRLNALADYETSEGGVIDPAALQNGSIPVWDAAAGAYRPVPASKLGDFIAGKPLYPLIFEKAGKEVYRYTPDVQKTVLDISDVASAKVLSNHISDASVHVTAAEREAWNLVASLFGVDSDGNVYVKGGKGFYGTSFVSARGSDPEAGTSGGGGLDEDALWDILTSPGTEKIDASHLPAITASMIEGLALASVAYAVISGTAGKVAHALTVKNDGGSSSASAKTFDGSAAVTVTIPTTLPASDVYAWAKVATKPSYTWGEIGGKPSVFTPAAHTHPLSDISDLHASWDALLKAAPSAYVTRWPAWGEVTGKPSSFTPAEHTHVKADITDFPTSWAWSAITGKPSTLAGYGIKDGVNSVTASGGLSASVSGHKLTVGVASGYAVPTSAQIGAWNLVASLFGVDSDGNVYVKGGKGFYGTSFVSARGSDPEAGQGGGTGVDMDAVWDALAAGTTEKINVSHLSATDLASLLTGAGYKLTDTIYTLPKATVSALGGIKAAGVRTSAVTTTQGGTTSGRYYGVELDSNGKAFVNVPWVNTTYSLSSFGITATAAEINKLDGLATTAKELGYVHGVTSAIQTQLNSKANASALASYLPLSGGTMTGTLTTAAIYLPEGYNIMYAHEGGAGMVGFRNGRTVLGSIGASTTAATQIRSITGHITTGAGDVGTYNVLDSGNFTSYTVTKTGGGASGTWPISISGNAATATKLATARTLWGRPFDGSGNVSGDMTGVGSITMTGSLSLTRTSSGVGLLVDNVLRSISWTVDTSGGWSRSLKATDPTGSTTLINVAGVYGAAQTPSYVYMGGTSFANAPFVVTAAGNVGIGTTSPGYKLDVRGAGYFSGVLGTNGMTLPYGGSSWITMASTPAVLQGSMNQSSNSAHPLFRVKNSSGDAIVFGGLGSNTGFYGFTAERISEGSNSYDWATTWNVGTGHLTHNGAMTATGLLTASGGLTTPQYVQVGSGRLKWDAANNALYVEKSDGTACGLYSKGYMSARGSDPEAATGGSSELVPVVTLSKLTVGTNVSISVLASAGLTNDVLEKMRDGAVGRIKAVFSDGSSEIWPVLHASNDFISFGYDSVLGGYQDTMNIYEITIPSKTTVIRVEHFER